MDKNYISDDLLYKLMPIAEEIILDQIPPDNEIDYVFSKTFDKKMKKLIKESKRSNITRALRKVAMIVLVALSIISVTIVSVEALRTRAFKIIKKVYDELTEITFEGIDGDLYHDGIDFVIMKPHYIPEGYKEVDYIEMNTMAVFIYENDEGEQIMYRQNKIEEYGTVILDTEDSKVEDVLIKGIERKIIVKGQRNHIIWFDDEYHYAVISTVGTKDLIKIAESIK
ncbi:MAG: DUF4367 domain-containing protein [Tissierella sp.]|nr:DUF4367 domain-containing protein [Tissierella sp.]